MIELNVDQIIAVCGDFTNGDVPVRLFQHYTVEGTRRIHPQSFTEGSPYRGVVGSVLLPGVVDESGFSVYELSAALMGSTNQGKIKRREMSRLVVSINSPEQLRLMPLEDLVAGRASLLDVVAVHATRLSDDALMQGSNVRLRDYRPRLIRDFIKQPEIFTSFGRAYETLWEEITMAFAIKFQGAQLQVGGRIRTSVE